MTDPSLYLYGTAACHLCDEAELLISDTLENPRNYLVKIDISSSDALVDQYGLLIPVLRGQDQQGQWRELRWPFNQQGLLAFLTGLEA